MADYLIKNALDEIHLETLKAIVEWLETYPVQIVIDTIKEEIQKLEN